MCTTAKQFFTNYSTMFLAFGRLKQNFSCSYFLGTFPVFLFFFSSCCCAHRLSPVSTDLVRFPKSSHISCRLGFVSFPSSRRFCVNEQLPPVCFFFFATNSPRLLPIRSLIVLSIFCSTGFFTSVSKVPSLPFWVSAVTATSLRASVFFSFVRLCKFLWILSRLPVF